MLQYDFGRVKMETLELIFSVLHLVYFKNTIVLHETCRTNLNQIKNKLVLKTLGGLFSLMNFVLLNILFLT